MEIVKHLRDYLSNKIVRFVLLLASLVILLGIFKFGYERFRSVDKRTRESVQATEDGIAPDKNAIAELAVQGMTCTGCIREIETALAGIDGIEFVLVDITKGKARVYFDPDRIHTSDVITEEISNAGYPASVIKILDP